MGISVKSLLALVATVAVTAPATPAVAAEPRNLQVMSWNMCGVMRWGCTGTGTPEQKVGVVEYHVTTNFVHAALLQEVCENDLTLLMNRLGAGWSRTFAPYQWSQDGRLSPIICDAPRTDRVGTAIVVKAGLSSARTYATTQPWTGMHRPFHCATATYWNARLCNAHLTPKGGNPDHPDWDYRDDQLAEIKAIVAGFPTLVFGGDLNVLPPDWPGNPDRWVWPTGLYSTGPATAGYLECDQQGAARTGRATHGSGAKIDYLFSTEERRWCAVGDSAYSDHHVLIESVAVA